MILFVYRNMVFKRVRQASLFCIRINKEEAMAYSKLEKLVIDGATPIAAEVGCYIYDVEYVKEGGTRYLRIYERLELQGHRYTSRTYQYMSP